MHFCRYGGRRALPKSQSPNPFIKQIPNALFHEIMECHDRSSRQPSLSPPSFDQGMTASNGRTRTSAGGVAFDFSTDGDEKFEIMSAQLPDQKTPAAHLSWLFLEQMRSRAGTKGRVSRKRHSPFQQQVRFHPAPSEMCRFPWTRVRFETWRRKRNPAEV